MSYHRRQSAPLKTPLAPDGTKLCKCGCGQPVGKGRRSWAGEECVEKWSIANNPQHVRMRLYQRDKGVCAKCGRNAERAQARCRNKWDISRRWDPQNRVMNAHRARGSYFWNKKIADLAKRWRDQWPRRYSLLVVLADRRRERMRAEGWPTHVTSSWWQADHIVPVSEGGGQPTSLDAYRTLCHGCHVEETKELRKRLRKQKNETTKELGMELISSALFGAAIALDTLWLVNHFASKKAPIDMDQVFIAALILSLTASLIMLF